MKKDFYYKKLGLKKEEILIVCFLEEQKRTKVLPMAKKINLPNSSVIYKLKKLEERGFVFKEKFENHFEWSLNKNFLENSFEDKKENKEKIKIYENLEKILEKREEIVLNNKGKRIYNLSAPINQKKALGGFSSKYIQKINEKGIKNKIIVDGVFAKSTFSQNKNFSAEELEKIEGRINSWAFLPDEYLNFPCSIIVHGDLSYIYSLEKEIMLEIKDKAVADTFVKLIGTLKEFGKKINFNQHLRNLISEKEKEEKTKKK